MSELLEATISAIDAAAPDWFAPLDRHAARLLGDLVGEADPCVRLAVALVSRQVRSGHVCLELRATGAAPGPVDEYGARLGDLNWPPVDHWVATLIASRLVAVVPDSAPMGTPPSEPRPMVLELPSGRLYLRRWWEHEAALARDLTARAGAAADHDPARLEEGLARLFPPVAGSADVGRRDQAAAAGKAVRRKMTVITGGPGTGKTTTVVRMLALLVEQSQAVGAPPPRVLLLAPTGKAAARLEEAVMAAREGLDVSSAVREAIPAEGRTIHRALRPRPDGSWRHTVDDPLPADVVVVDEASMIDVALMRALVTAVRPEARLVVLGDRDQLASVDAGAVLADMCGPPAMRQDPDSTRDDPCRPMAPCIATLSHSFRFGPETGIGALARAVLAGDADLALEVLDDPRQGDVARVDARPVDRAGRLHPAMADLVAVGYRPYLDTLGAATRDQAEGEGYGGGAAEGDGDRAVEGDGGGAAEGFGDGAAEGDGDGAAEGDRAVEGNGDGAAAVARALQALGLFRILCAHRRGPLGVGTSGKAVVEALTRSGRISPAGQHWHGRPIIITRNDYGSRLFNGDVGLLARDPQVPGRLRAFFPGTGGLPRAVSPARLPPHETVFAMSIHKSQGSEFDVVAVVLPEDGSPLLTRELLYTAVTRARKSVTVFGAESAFRSAVGRRAERASGLRARLWGE